MVALCNMTTNNARNCLVVLLLYYFFNDDYASRYNKKYVIAAYYQHKIPCIIYKCDSEILQSVMSMNSRAILFVNKIDLDAVGGRYESSYLSWR